MSLNRGMIKNGGGINKKASWVNGCSRGSVGGRNRFLANATYLKHGLSISNFDRYNPHVNSPTHVHHREHDEE